MGCDIAEKYRICADGLRAFAESAGFTDAVIGLSGGIDSSVVACICADVFGSDHVHGYLLPGPYSSEHSITDAQLLARALGISCERVSIVEAYESFARTLAPHCKGHVFQGLAAENTQARCRMIVLMALSNEYGWMLVNTGNKSEACMGYSTLYGDTAGAFAPIGGLYKTDVFALARYINAQAEARGLCAPIPGHVLTKPPSAELAPGQTDEATLGSYAILDAVLIDHVERDMDEAGLIAAGHAPEDVRRIVLQTARFAFKRALEPQYPAIPYA